MLSQKAETHKVGNQKAGGRFTGWGDFQSLKGRARGLLIDGIECPAKVKTFSFRLNHNEWDSVVFRLNFMKTENGKIGESILQENIFLTTSLKHKWVNVDLSKYNIMLCSRVIATLEWVDAWGKLGKYSNLLTLSLSKNSGYTFNKEAGEEFGSLTFSDDAPAMYLEVYGD